MARQQDSYPEAATNAEAKRARSSNGEAALEEALDVHSKTLASVIESSDKLEEGLATAIIVAASADDEELEHLASSAANLVQAADGLSTDGAAALATDLGDNADDLSGSLDTVLELEREGHLDDLVELATAFTESLSSQEIAELSTMLEKNGTEFVEAFDLILDLQREGHLKGIVEIARTLSKLEVDDDAADGLNTLLASMSDAQRESEPVGLLGMLGGLRSRDARAGLGYLLALLKAQGRRIRGW